MFREAIERGAALLDERKPGWMDEIEFSLFATHHACNCVLGLNYGGFAAGLIALGLECSEEQYPHAARYAVGAYYGFAVPEGAEILAKRNGLDWREPWRTLTHEWKEFIESRRSAAV